MGPFHSAFPHLHTTEMGLFQVAYDLPVSLEAGHSSILVLLDFPAVDMVNHTILLGQGLPIGGSILQACCFVEKQISA